MFYLGKAVKHPRVRQQAVAVEGRDVFEADLTYEHQRVAVRRAVVLNLCRRIVHALRQVRTAPHLGAGEEVVVGFMEMQAYGHGVPDIKNQASRVTRETRLDCRENYFTITFLPFMM